jgi:hypothetical protein
MPKNIYNKNSSLGLFWRSVKAYCKINRHIAVKKQPLCSFLLSIERLIQDLPISLMPTLSLELDKHSLMSGFVSK